MLQAGNSENASLTLTYAKWVNLALTGDYAFGKTNDEFVTAEISKSINLFRIGKKDIITEGDLPVVWTNTKYRMLYINMGHGPMVYGDPIQNKLFENAILWLGNDK